ncbi:hypothetical protein Hamer_G011130 [Homarus americanus]|uniref:Uncharacterized protein n=1 Tax=Homarus americanus TaxID=6706 RepID=A0A8J5K146_HOMAM|nr:hypothetical protein Hamer_G011130 [Homarus americanus]
MRTGLIIEVANLAYRKTQEEEEDSYGIADSASRRTSYPHPSSFYKFLDPSVYPPRSRQQRAITQGIGEMEEAEKLLLSAATHLDTDGCVLKLLCHLNNKQVDARTLEETVLLQMFSDNLETMSSYNTAFQETRDVDQTQDQVTCDKMFPNCPLTEEELGSLLRQTWGCGSLNH